MQILKKKQTLGLGIAALTLLSVQTVSADIWNTDYSGTITNVYNLSAYKPETLPINLKPYALNPASLGMAYGNGTGWYGMTGAWNDSAGQCVGLVRGLMGKLWTKNGVPFDSRGNGHEMVSIATNTYGVAGKSFTPTAGAMFSYSEGTYGHAGVVSHVFQNGDILVVEQNIKGFSGDNNGQKFTYSYRYINKATYSGIWSFYNPAKVGFTMNANAKAVTNTATTTTTTTTPKPTTTTPTITATTMPSSGTYKFTTTLPVRSAPSSTASIYFNYPAGLSVNYDQVTVAGGRQWISYVSGGVRRYIDVAPAHVTSAPKPTTTTPITTTPKPTTTTITTTTPKPTTTITTQPTLPRSGTYKFTTTLPVRSAPSSTASIYFNYPAGLSVNYDQVTVAGGRQWISYVSGGVRRYIDVAPATTTTTTAPKPTTTTTSTPTPRIVSGAYTFKSQSAVKSSTLDSSPALAYYSAGQTVYYDRIITENGRTFYSYLSSSGARRYVEAK